MDIQKASDWLQKYGSWSVFICRLIPLIQKFNLHPCWNDTYGYMDISLTYNHEIHNLESPVSLCRCLRWGIMDGDRQIFGHLF